MQGWGATCPMGGNVWHPTVTRHTRYCCGSDKAISQHVLRYSSLRRKKCLKILDVGCSTGWAARHMAGYLWTLGVDCTIDGLDRSKIVKMEAVKNLNKFHQCELFDADIEPVYDVVICSRLLRFLEPPYRCEGVHKCASFCNDNGVVITDGIPNVSSAIGGYVMLSPDAIRKEAVRHLEDRNWKRPPVKLFICRLKSLINRCLGVSCTRLDRLVSLSDQIARCRCQYCKPER